MEQALATGIFAAFGTVILIVVIVVTALFIAAEWKILTKAGEKGWKSLIPFYNIYISHKIVGMSHIWFVLEIIAWIVEILLEIVSAIPSSVGLVFGIATGIFTLVSEVIHIVRMCDCFGKGTAFKVGMVLIPDLFLLILAFGKAEYKKPTH